MSVGMFFCMWVCVTPSVCMYECVCGGGGGQIARCILDDCDNFTSSVELSARLLKFQPYPFSCCLWRKETEWFKKKKKKAVVASIHLSHVLRLAFPLTWNATVYQTHLYVCLEMGRFGINPSAAQLGYVLLCVHFFFLVLQLWVSY